MDGIGFFDAQLKSHCPMDMLNAMEERYKMRRLRSFLKDAHFLKDIGDYSHVTFFWMNNQWEYLGSNEAVLKLLGLSWYVDVVGKTNVQIFKRWGRDIGIAKKIDKENKYIYMLDSYCLLNEDIGEKGKVLTIKGPLLNRYGNIAGMIGISKYHDTPKIRHRIFL